MVTTVLSRNDRTHIDVRIIEHELNQLWANLAKENDTNKPHSITRTCVLNLIVVTGGGRAAEYATATVAQLTARHPNRAFVISAAPKSQNNALNAWVQIHCELPLPGRPQVCGEQISITARGSAVDRVASTILSLLVPDVPVMLWWPHGEPFQDRRYAKYARLVDRIIVDSTTFAAPEQGLVRMAAQINAGSAVSDLAWSRLTPWRELIAQFFDAHALVPHLSEITHVIVDYQAAEGETANRSQALLLVSWLAARLGWHVVSSASRQLPTTELQLRSASNAPIHVALQPTPPTNDALDHISAITLVCHRARFRVEREEAGCVVATTYVEGMPQIQRKVHFDQFNEAMLLTEELQLLNHDSTFEAVLQIVATLLES